MTTRFSIIITTKDRPHLLRRALASALRNVVAGGEIIVVDDHSSIPAGESVSIQKDDPVRIVQLGEAETGISAARNAGIAQSVGDVIFFLDDDDTMDDGYCDTVMTQALHQSDYGFSAYRQVGDDGKTTLRVRFEDGPVPVTAPLHKRICGFGMGFWMKREVAIEIGEISTELSINEDTEYLCRLIQAGKTAWYTAKPSLSIYTAHRTNGDAANTTVSTSPAERARCMRIVCDGFPDMIGHLGPSYIRHCAKTGELSEAWQFVQSQPSWMVRVRLALFLGIKSVAYRISGRASKPETS